MRFSNIGGCSVALTLLNILPYAAGQTSTSCNPLESTSCSADPALGTSVSIDLTSGADTDAFTADGTVTYDSTNGAAFTISAKGDAPQLNSNWYIMFGKVTYTIKAAPGQGVVSSAVLQSDDLDEIDWEWVGNQETSAQSNYFGKGITSSYNRGGNHVLTDGTTTSGFHTYTIDWTDERIVWQIDGTTVRTLTSADAESNQYPQTPCQVKVGVWAGGDSSNAEGTIEWAGGEIDYANGPYTMYMKAIEVTDYSTGTEYTYDGTAGTWESIKSTGGTINGNADSDDTSSSATETSTATSAISGTAVPYDTCSGWKASCESSTATQTGWPWVGTASTTAVSSSSVVSYSGATSTSQFPSSSQYLQQSSTSYTGTLETITAYNQQGFPTVVCVDPGRTRSYDDSGTLITEACGAAVAASTAAGGSAITTTSAGQSTITSTVVASQSTASTSSSGAVADSETSSIPLVYATTSSSSSNAAGTTASGNAAPSIIAVKEFMKVIVVGAVGLAVL